MNIDAGDSKKYLLLLDQDHEQFRKMHHLLDFIGYQVVAPENDENWESCLDDYPDIQIIILGQWGKDRQHRLELYDDIYIKYPHIPIIALNHSHQHDENNRVLAEKAFACLNTPLKYTQLAETLHRAQIYRANSDSHNIELFRSLVGSSQEITRVRELIQQVAGSAATVLILGESGTGKEVVARNLHHYSSRKSQAFMPINCGAIPSELMESELFGHEKGSFTGAFTARQGRFEMAEKGTIFLDEIGDMPQPMQVKLLRVLQERCFERVGGNSPINVDVRVIAATHRNLEELIIGGGFREDLYYRLNVFPIEMPALRERIEDIPLLIKELITRLEHEHRGSVRLTPEAVMSLCQYQWPGNVRELANLIERMVIMYPFGVVDVNDLPEKYRSKKAEAKKPVMVTEAAISAAMENIKLTHSTVSPITKLPADGLDLKDHLAEIEHSLIKQALDEADGVVAHAAKLLNIRRTTLVEKMRKHDLQRENAS